MEKDGFNYLYLIIFFALCLFFINSLLPEHYPDNENLRNKLISNDYELTYTIQNIFVRIFNFLECKIIIDHECSQKKISDLNRVLFFIPTFFLIIFIFILNSYFFIKEKKNKYLANDIFLSCLCFPSVLLSITSLSSEASFTVISIFIILNVTNLKKIHVNFLILIILLIYCFQLDRGNSMVFSFFLLGLYFLTYTRNNFSFKLFLLMIAFISLIILIFENDIFNFIGKFIFTDKIRGLNEEVERLNLQNLSFIDIMKRYFYFWITLTSFMLPNKTFIFSFSVILISYLIFSIFNKEKILYKIKQFNLSYLKKNDQVLYIWLIIFPIFMISIFPTHAYAKYYLFYLPPILRLCIIFLNFRPFFKVVFFSSFVSIIEYNAWLIN